MTDVVEIAKERRVRLAAEIGKLDDFIRMAEALVKYSQGLGRGPVIDADGAAPRVLLPDRGRDADCIREDMEVRDGAAVTVTTIEKTVPVEDGVRNVSFQSDLAHNNALAQASAAFRAGADNFAFNDKASASEDELVLVNPLSNDAAPVDVHVGQRIRQRRWMMGITQQRLGGLVGVELEQIQKYETGAIHIGAGRMWDVAAAMEVPMSYFFEGLDGQAPDTGEARGEILTDKKALALVRGAPRARTAVAS